ncbi:MAG TPA: HAMP domain-containing sensor histidine kinase, partial [Oscillatoriaceae cyanobacterium]
GTLQLSTEEALPRAFWDDGMCIQYTALDGSVLHKSTNLRNFRLPTPVYGGVSRISLPLPQLVDSDHLLMFSRLLRLKYSRQTLWVEVAYPLEGFERTMNQLAISEIAGWLLSVLLALGAGYFFAGRALAPVVAITSTVRGWTQADLHRRLPSSPDEIGVLASTFNGLFDRLQGAFDAQARFVADASHELKSPLTAIRGHLQLLQRRGADNPEEARGWLATAMREVDRLSRLVEDLLDLARVDAELPTMTMDRVEVAAIAREVAEQFQVLAPRVGFAGGDGPLWVRGDGDRLRQVLINLTDNAVRATRDRGEVTLSVRREGNQACLEVADTGMGIPQAALARIFDRFYRLDSARARDEGGTGLGLAIIASIVDAHGGRIEVTSEEGRGTTFTIRLPADQETSRTPAA